MKRFKMLSKKERQMLVEEIKKGVSEGISEAKFSDETIKIIELVKEAMKEGKININLSGFGYSSDGERLIFKIEADGDIKTLSEIFKK